MSAWIDVKIELEAANEVIKESIIDLLGKVKRSWATQKVNIQQLTSGFSNSMWLCCFEEDARPVSEPAPPYEHTNSDNLISNGDRDKVVVRIFPDNSTHPTPDRDFEVQIMTQMAQKGVCKPMLARFLNGFVYEYAEGEILKGEDMKDPEILRLLFEKLYVVHTMNGQVSRGRDKGQVLGNLEALRDKLPGTFQDERIQKLYETEWMSKEEVLNEANLCRQIIDDIHARYPPILIHGDLFYNNIVFNRSSQEVWLIDWEYASLGAAPLELAFTFDDFLGPSPFSHEFKKQLIKTYLQCSPESQEVTEDVVNVWLQDVIKAQMAIILASIMWIMWLLPKTKDKDGFTALLQLITPMYKKFKKEVSSF